MSLLLIIVVLVLLFGGGGGYYGYSRYGSRGAGGILGTVLIVLLVVWLLGGIQFYPFLTSDPAVRHASLCTLAPHAVDRGTLA